MKPVTMLSTIEERFYTALGGKKSLALFTGAKGFGSRKGSNNYYYISFWVGLRRITFKFWVKETRIYVDRVDVLPDCRRSVDLFFTPDVPSRFPFINMDEAGLREVFQSVTGLDPSLFQGL